MTIAKHRKSNLINVKTLSERGRNEIMNVGAEACFVCENLIYLIKQNEERWLKDVPDVVRRKMLYLVPERWVYFLANCN